MLRLALRLEWLLLGALLGRLGLWGLGARSFDGDLLGSCAVARFETARWADNPGETQRALALCARLLELRLTGWAEDKIVLDATGAVGAIGTVLEFLEDCLGLKRALEPLGERGSWAKDEVEPMARQEEGEHE
jgi:hypothetical protein